MINPSEGGSYIRHPDGTLERVEFTKPAGGAAEPERAAGPEGADTGPAANANDEPSVAPPAPRTKKGS
jgi:hypothetical protein